MLDVLPTPIYEDIKKHLIDRAKAATKHWESASEDEDTLTGTFGTALEINRPAISVNGQIWSWRITWKKFRGRGRGAFEKSSGADGIFQVEVNTGSATIVKGMLFQAKKKGMNGQLVSQIERMEQLATNSSAVIEYGPDEYRGVSGSVYLKNAGTLNESDGAFKSLGQFLADDFLPCTAGLRGMYYDAVRGVLVLPNGATHRISVRQRIRIEAEKRES